MRFRNSIVLALLSVSCVRAASVSQTADIRTYLNAISIPGANSETFVPPGDSDIATWRRAVDALLTAQYAQAATIADPLGYDVVKVTDSGRAKAYYVLRERSATSRGLGTYVYNPSACRMISLHVPHASADANTKPEAIALFAELNAVTLLIAGTHRCANADASACDGNTTACGASGKFRISDVAHYTQNFFEPAHEEVIKNIPGVISVAIHGEGTTRSPDVLISNGTCTTPAGQSLPALLAAQFNRIFTDAGGTLKAGTCNSPGGSTDLCAEVDVQGRFANGSASLCNCQSPAPSACSTTLGCVRAVSFPEKFIHVEQDCAVRQLAGCDAPAGIGYQTAIDAFAAVFPCVPKINAVVQGASFRVEPLAPGSFFSIFGDGLGTIDQSGATAAFSLGGVKVQTCGTPSRLFYNSGAGQLNGVVPVSAAGKTQCDVVVSADGGFPLPSGSSAYPVQITPQNIALFPYAVSSTLTVPIITNAAYQLIGPDGPGFVRAKKNSVIILWATGLGLTTPLVPDSQVAPGTLAPAVITPSIKIGDIAVTPAYSGLAPGFIGLYQINVQVPANAASGKVPLMVNTAQYDLWVE